MDQHAAGGGAPLADDVGCRVRHGVLGDGRKVGHQAGIRLLLGRVGDARRPVLRVRRRHDGRHEAVRRVRDVPVRRVAPRPDRVGVCLVYHGVGACQHGEDGIVLHWDLAGCLGCEVYGMRLRSFRLVVTEDMPWMLWYLYGSIYQEDKRVARMAKLAFLKVGVEVRLGFHDRNAAILRTEIACNIGAKVPKSILCMIINCHWPFSRPEFNGRWCMHDICYA